jgi:hypothetical protein
MSDKIERHVKLVNAMSRKLGVDLGRRVVEGTMNPSDLGHVIVTCGRCGNVAACEDFVCRDAESADGAGDGVPDYCLNGLFFSVLNAD